MYVSNPPWVTHALADAYASIVDVAPPAWLPQLDRVRSGPKGTLVGTIKEYGCGVYGCVIPTLDKDVVMKVTTDETEAQFAADLAADLVEPIVTTYHMVMSLSARHQNRPIYALWREAAEHVGEIDEVVGRYAERAIARQHRIAQVTYYHFHGGRLELALMLIKDWLQSLDDMADIEELRFLANGMRRIYQEQGIFFGDVHSGNVGLVKRDGAWQWVITDPGHVAVMHTGSQNLPAGSPQDTE